MSELSCTVGWLESENSLYFFHSVFPPTSCLLQIDTG